MAEASVYAFSFKELTEMMIRKQGIHEGHWAIRIKFGLGAANFAGMGAGTLLPTAFVPVVEIGIQKQDAPTDLTVDAAQANPVKPKRKKGA
jgi:hypothetical protein